MIRFFQFTRDSSGGTLNLYVRPREDMSRLHPMSRLGRRKLRRAAFIAARVRMTLGGSFENSNLRSRARARTKLVRQTILDRAVGIFSGVHKRVGELAFAPDSTPPARWALARKTLEDGREVRLSLEADAKRHLCERHIRA